MKRIKEGHGRGISWGVGKKAGGGGKNGREGRGADEKWDKEVSSGKGGERTMKEGQLTGNEDLWRHLRCCKKSLKKDKVSNKGIDDNS